MHNGTWLASKADLFLQGIGAAQDAVRMQNVVSFYEKLPRGAAPEIKAKGLLERYRARYFGKNASAMRALPYSTSTSLLCVANCFNVAIVHVIASLMALGYGMEYFFHLRHHKNNA